MSDYASARAAGIAAVDELDLWQGQPTLSSQLASVTTLQQQVAALQGQVTTLTNSNNARQTAIDNMKIQATQDQANDDARQAGAGVLAASGGF